MKRNNEKKCDVKRISALEAITEAQKIAFAPMFFQATMVMLREGLLAFLDGKGASGATLHEAIEQSSLNAYAVELLLDVAVSGEVVYREGERFVLSKIGHFLLHNRMTQVNLNFVQDVCYEGAFRLGESFKEERPAGLGVFGSWATIYPVLSQLPSQAQKSWFEFDHFYSDDVYDAVLPHVFAQKPAQVYDVGGNTGKFALKCCRYDADVQVKIVDLPEQIELAMQNVTQQGVSDRIKGHAANLLTDDPLPTDADAWWMSQFLDCFSKDQVVSILEKIRHAMKPGSKVYILELFPDRQPFAAGELSLNMSSLYFTCMANGNSRFYYSKPFIACIEKAGFIIEKQVNELGTGAHTLLVCSPKG